MKTYGVIYEDKKELVSIVLDEEGNPRLDTLKPHDAGDGWEPPTIIPLIKKPSPDIDIATHYVEPKLVWFEDRVERQWEVLPIPPKPQIDTASAEARRAAKAAEAERYERIHADYKVEPEGFYLLAKEEDQNILTRLLALINLTNMPDTNDVTVIDSTGLQHTVKVSRFKEILIGYGMEIYNRIQTYK
jgi:hypothetical protein